MGELLLPLAISLPIPVRWIALPIVAACIANVFASELLPSALMFKLRTYAHPYPKFVCNRESTRSSCEVTHVPRHV